MTSMSTPLADNYVNEKIRAGLDSLSPNERDKFMQHVENTFPKRSGYRKDLYTASELDAWTKGVKRQGSTSTLTGDDSVKDGPGKVELGDWNVVQTLGEGTFGKVRLCEHKMTKEKVAIKSIQKADVKTPKQRNSVQREVRLMKLLNHPNIVHVYDVEENADSISIIMEFAAGGELFDYIVAQGMLKEKESRMFFRQILSAVDYCHQNSVIHRDLKPENMLLDANKNIKLIDFGFGNTYHADSQLETYCGSPFYAAPEMIRGQPYCGPEVDVWSLGVIMYALLAGRLPFESPVISDLYQEIGRGEYPVPRHFSQSAVKLIGRMLTVDPMKRATMQEILLHPWVNDGYLTSPESKIPPRPKFVLYPNPDTFAELIDFGIDEREIKRVLSSNLGLHPISSLYHLVDEARLRRESNSYNQDKNPGCGSQAPGVDMQRYNSKQTVFSPSLTTSPIANALHSPPTAHLGDLPPIQSRYNRAKESAASNGSESSEDDLLMRRRNGIYRPAQTEDEVAQNQSNITATNSNPIGVPITHLTSAPPADHPTTHNYNQTWTSPIQDFFYGKTNASNSANPHKKEGTRKNRFSFVTDHLFNMRAEMHVSDRDVIKVELERVLKNFGIDFYLSNAMDTFMCRERIDERHSFTIDIHQPQPGEKIVLFFKSGPGIGHAFSLRKLYSKMLDELRF